MAASATGPLSARIDFVDGLNVLFLISGLLAIAGGIAAVALIRRKDFVVHTEAAPPTGDAKTPAPDAVGAS